MEAQRAIRVLRQFLETDALLGVAETPIRHGAGARAAIDAEGRSQSMPASLEAVGKPATIAPSSTPGASVRSLNLGTGSARERFERLAAALAADAECVSRLGGAPPTLGEGALPARVVFVGEPPGSGHDADEAATLLDGMVKAMKLGADDVFRCPCLPFAPRRGDHPSPADLAAGGVALRAQVLLADPEVVVAMGGAAARAVLGTTVGITRLRGTWATCGWTDPPVPVMPTFSPAFVLRSYTKDNRMRVWGDLQEVMAKLAQCR